MAGRDRVGCQTIGHVYLTTNFDSSGVNCAKECNSQMVGGGGGACSSSLVGNVQN